MPLNTLLGSEEQSPLVRAALLSLKVSSPFGLVGTAAITAGISGLSQYFQGRAIKRSMEKQKDQLTEAARRTEKTGAAQQSRAEAEAVSRYRSQRALGDEQAGDLYSRSMEIGFRQRDYAEQRAQELRSQASQIAAPKTKDVIRGALATAVQEGITDYVSGHIRNKQTDALQRALGRESEVTTGVVTGSRPKDIQFKMPTVRDISVLGRGQRDDGVMSTMGRQLRSLIPDVDEDRARRSHWGG